MKSLPVKIIYVFAPHPDDETLGNGGTIISKISEGYQVKIIVLTDGANSHASTFNILTNPSPKEIAKIRKQECLKATHILGVKSQNVFFLNGKDGYLFQEILKMKKKIKQLLNNDIEHLSEIYLTHQDDYHCDHRSTHKIVISVLKQLKLNIPVFLYKIYDSSSINCDKEKIEIDIANFHKTKIMALKQYKSQTTNYSKKQTRSVIPKKLLNKFFSLKKEIFWPVKMKFNN